MEIKRIEAQQIVGNNTFNLSISDLSAGIYYCVINNQGIRTTKNFVVVR